MFKIYTAIVNDWKSSFKNPQIPRLVFALID